MSTPGHVHYRHCSPGGQPLLEPGLSPQWKPGGLLPSPQPPAVSCRTVGQGGGTHPGGLRIRGVRPSVFAISCMDVLPPFSFSPFFSVDSVAVACNLNPGQHPLSSVGRYTGKLSSWLFYPCFLPSEGRAGSSPQKAWGSFCLSLSFSTGVSKISGFADRCGGGRGWVPCKQ